jgi:hypothetical protein
MGDHTVRCIHFVGFKDDRYWSAVKIWGPPTFIHRWWDKLAAREIADGDVVVFAEGDWRQEPRRFNAPDLIEEK